MTLIQNPERRAWIKQDQAILSAIVGSLTLSVSGLVLFAKSAYDAWTTLTTSFGSQSTARSMQIRNKLGHMKKCDLSTQTFYNQVKTAADTLASIGQPLRDTEVASFVLNGLDQDYDGLTEAVEGRENPISAPDLLSRLLSTEQHVEARRAANTYTEASANATYRGNRPQQGGGGGGAAPRPTQQQFQPRQPPVPTPPAPNMGGGAPRGGNGRRNDHNDGNRPVCQLCGIIGHIVSRCYKRFNRDFSRYWK
jgi:hypothetical protein